MSYSKTLIHGHVGADPVLRHSQSNVPVCSLSVATNYGCLVDGERQEKTEWHRIVVFNKQAESCAKYLAKGGEVLVDGRNQTRKYTDKEGTERTITEIIAHRVDFVGGKSKTETVDPLAELPSMDDIQDIADEDIPF